MRLSSNNKAMSINLNLCATITGQVNPAGSVFFPAPHGEDNKLCRISS